MTEEDYEPNQKPERHVEPKKQIKVRKAICKAPAKAPAAKQRLSELKQRAGAGSKSYMNFDFFYKRTLFRTMTIFYKQEFKVYFDQFSKQKDTAFPIQRYLVQFTQDLHPGLLESMSSDAEVQEYLKILEQVVFCHRFNKQDAFLTASPLIDYSIVRDPMYKYSKVAQENFFKVPVLTFLFGWFCASNQGQEFMVQRSSDSSQCADFGQKMLSEAG